MVWQQIGDANGSHLEEIISVSTVQRRLKGFSSMTPVNCSNGTELHNSKMGEVCIAF